MIGAIVGDIIGSIYEFDNIKTKNFTLFDRNCMFTDDTVMTIAVGEALSKYHKIDEIKNFQNYLIKTMHKYGKQYPDVGYGGRFEYWLESEDIKPYNSFGNGSAMRVSPCGWFANTLDEAEKFAEASSIITHNHPEGIKGAKVTSAAIWMAKNGESKDNIKKYVSKYYNINFTLDKIRPTYQFDVTCQGSVPQAIEAFFESTGFEDAIRNAISIGGDSDTIAAITGSIAEAYYGIDEDIKETALSYLDDYLLDELENILEVLKNA